MVSGQRSVPVGGDTEAKYIKRVALWCTAFLFATDSQILMEVIFDEGQIIKEASRYGEILL